jgi:hypothetical protein
MNSTDYGRRIDDTANSEMAVELLKLVYAMAITMAV